MTQDAAVFIESNDNVKAELQKNDVILSLGDNLRLHIDGSKVDEVIEALEGAVYDKTYNQLDEEVTELRIKVSDLEEEVDQYKDALANEQLERII